MSANDPLDNGGKRDTEVVTPSALLLKEMDETNNWARLGAQLYFGWFTLMLTINGLATGWLFTRNGTPQFARLIFGIFIGLNLVATIAALYIRKHMLDCERRITEVIETLTQYRSIEDRCLNPQSPVALRAINTVFAYTTATLIMLLLFWTTLEIWPQIILGAPPRNP